MAAQSPRCRAGKRLAFALAPRSRRKDNNCQPNFRRDVCPEPSTSCGPYHLRSDARSSEPVSSPQVERSGPRPGVAPAFPTHGAHDTISLVAVAPNGSAAAACSTNGAIHKIPGRVGDGAAPGAGAYADSSVGACGATGDGDVHLRFLPCYQVCGEGFGEGWLGWPAPWKCSPGFLGGKEASRARGSAGTRAGSVPWTPEPCSQAQGPPGCSRSREARRPLADHDSPGTHAPAQVVESMRRGLTPTEAAEDAIRRIARRVPGYVGAVLAVDRCGRLGAAAAGWDFTYSYRHAGSAGVKVVHVPGLAPESAGSAATAA